MELLNLRPIAPGSASSWNLKLHCVECGTSTMYQNAVHAGWTFDRDGVAFSDYYCPVCTKKHTNPE